MPRTPVNLSPRETRRLVLNSQGLPASGFDRGLAGTRQAIQHLGYVQIDTISVVARAHHHTLWARVPHYRSRFLNRLIADRSVFEYWSHAAAYLPMSDFRFCLPRMRAMANGQRHWYPRNPALMKEILARVRVEGPVQARDFDTHRGHSSGMWEWGPVKQAIESLFMEGKLMVTRRDNFQKVFDLTERVLPVDTDLSVPGKNEYAQFLVRRYLRSNGIGRAVEFGYLRKGMGNAIKQALTEQCEAGELIPATVGRSPRLYYLRPDYEHVIKRRLRGSLARILSPFDNLLIQRKRVADLFDFEHQLECYVPAAKRKFGYFCLPVLYGDRLVAQIDAKAERKSGELLVRKLELSVALNDVGEFGRRLSKALAEFAHFNACDKIRLGSLSDSDLKRHLSQQAALFL